MPRMRRPAALNALLAAFAVVILAVGTALAQEAPAPGPTAPATAPAAGLRDGEAPAPAPAVPATVPALGADAAARLAEILRDERRRAELIEALDAIARAAPAPSAAGAADAAARPRPAAQAEAPPAGPEAERALPLAPDSLGAQLLVALSERLVGIGETTIAVVQTLADAPQVWTWVTRVAADPAARTGVLETLWKIALVLGAGILVERLLILALRPVRARLLTREPANWTARGLAAVGDFMLDVLPIVAFAIVSYSLITAVERWPSRQIVLLVANNAYLAARLARALGRLVFSPDAPSLRLIPRMSDETAAYAQIWLQRITTVGVIGYAATEAALVFGLDRAAHSGLLKLLGLVITAMLVLIVMQNREAVGDAIRAGPGTGGPWAVVRNRLADVWHILAALYLAAAWVVTALEIEDGYGRILRFTVTTILVVGLAKLTELAMRRALERGFAVKRATAERHPGLESWVNRYVPALKGVLAGTIWAFAAVVMLQLWGFGAFDWFRPGQLGSRLLGAVASIGVTVLIALLVWESANAAIQRHLDRLSRDAQAARSARVRTLLPMLRTFLMVVIVVVVALIALSEIGVNIAPLLAGAGVIGLAIGFGSQRLVQDLITGIFLLMEDAIAVGDVVNVAGQGGVVEALSIRSIRLRSLDGTVHIIPFSAVNMVSNMTKDFAFAVFDVGVAYHEDTDRVVEVLKAVAEEMRSEDRWAAVIREPLEILGVDRFADSAVVIRARFRTNPGSQWSVSREFNRRYKKAFDAAGIEIPFPYRTVVLKGEGGTPALTVDEKRAIAAAGAA
ncbi:mechanosensitive ion channel family protein [Elioraea sp.]|uniref:mechanosensitive ion channel family protein n=1 Tax=Elioraea sp. TaxID=2185103 RepID=UPI0021DE5C50|nr:mechanosensitive ion channel domain-containing protein [Elioraea sp.]GIX10257.1 MAG: mechanosensitive ion channel protein MscS [Elioraea sp.]